MSGKFSKSILAGPASGDVKRLNPHLFGNSELYRDPLGKSCVPKKSVAKVQDSPAETTVKTFGKRRGEPNKTEARFHQYLLALNKYRQIDFEGVTLRLPDGMRYTPDFHCVTDDGKVELFEVKGAFIRPIGLIKFRAAKIHFGTTYKMELYKWANSEWSLYAV
jgi:hypothetical protein